MAKFVNNYPAVETGEEFKRGDIIGDVKGDIYIVACTDTDGEGGSLLAAISLRDGNRWEEPMPERHFTSRMKTDGFQRLPNAKLTLTREDV